MKKLNQSLCRGMLPARLRTVVACGLALLLWQGGAAPAPARADGISEPYTVIYGKVLGTGSAQPFLITSGQLTWRIRLADGQLVTLTSSLFADGANGYSYRLHVPHTIVALGLPPDPNAIPMPPMPQVHLHEAVMVDGDPAVLLGPAGATFTTEQLLRTATYRLDLGLNRLAPDSDGDGLPDWWEDRYGLDKQDPTDAALQISGDGISALEAYRRGLDPTMDHRAPALLTEEAIVYTAGTTALLLDAFDLDSAAAQLRYRLTRTPAAGAMILRNAQASPLNPDLVLAVGGEFTQADLLRGRVVYEYDGSGNDPAYVGLELRDEDENHVAVEKLVRLLAYEPEDYVPQMLPAAEIARLENHYCALQGMVVMDAAALPADAAIAAPSAGLADAELDAYLAAYGEDRYYALSGGGTGSSLSGGHQDDVLNMRATAGRLTGGAGADRFVFHSFEQGSVTIADFNPAEGDVIDLSRLPALPGAYAQRYLALVAVAGGQELRLDSDGAGAGSGGLVIALPGLTASATGLYDLVEAGSLLLGALRLEPLLSVAATLPTAARSGPTAGRFTISRRGFLEGDVYVNILMGGSALNNVDYEYVAPTVRMPAGEEAVNIALMPYANGDLTVKLATLTLLAGDGYGVAAPQAATVTIEPLKMVAEVTALFTKAVKNGDSGLFEVRRRHVVDNAATLYLTLGGSAVRGTDYILVAHDATLLVNQSTAVLSLQSGRSQALIEVVILPGAALSAGARTVELTLRAHEGYLIRDGYALAQVALIERLDNFQAWRAREFPEATGDTVAFASDSSGGAGVTHFQRYAFGLDPRTAGGGGLPRPFMHEGRLVVTFRRPLGVTDVKYDVIGLTNLLDRDGSRVAMQEIAAPDGTRDPERVFYRMETGAPSGFATVTATLK